MMSEIRFYLGLFWRRLPLFLLVFSSIAVIGVFAALTLPAVYQSNMRLVVESSQIPGKLAQSTVDVAAQEQLQLFEARLMTRSNLLQVATELRALPDQQAMNPDQIVAAMRAATTIRSSTGRDQATIMTISYDSRQPRIAAAVLDKYLTFLLDQDAQFRATRAGETQDFFQQEVDNLSSKLSEQSAKILAFKTSHSDALPDSQNFSREQLLDLQDRLGQNERDIASFQDQKKRLTQIYEATGRVGSAGGQLSPEEQRIQDLKNQLAELQAVYTPGNPRVTNLQNRIRQLESALAGANGEVVTDPAQAMYDMQLGEIDSRIQQLQDNGRALQTQIDALQDQLSRIPANAVALDALERDYENIQNQYNDASNRLAAAATGERIETLSRGQRVTVLEQPAVPDDPVRPNRKKLALMGVMMGLVIAGGLVLALELLPGTIKRSSDMSKGLGIEPMVTIPFMRTRQEILRQRIMRIGLSLGVCVAVPLALFLVHTYYMPFDLIAQKVAARLGIFI